MRNIFKKKINIGINHYGEISLFAQGKRHSSNDDRELADNDEFVAEKDSLQSKYDR